MPEEKTIKEKIREVVCEAADKAEKVNDGGTGVGERIAKELRELADCKDLKN